MKQKNRNLKNFEGSSLMEVLEVLNKSGKEKKKRDAEQKEVNNLLESIQSLHENNSKRVDRVFGLFGRGRTVDSLRSSVFGRFMSSEIQRQLHSLNARGGSLEVPRGGGFLSNGGPRAQNTGSLYRNAKELLKMKFPGLFKGSAASIGAAGAAGLGGAVASNYWGGSGSSSSNSSSNTAGSGERQSYADLSQFNDRGSRNVNPGNVTGSGYLGQAGKDDKGHAIFATKEAGVAGVVDRLYRYNRDYDPKDRGPQNKKTIREIMYTYAPPNDGNDTEGYIASISKKLGIGADEKIDFKKNPELLKPFVQAIMRKESPGVRAYSDDNVNKGIEIGIDSALLGKDAAREKHAAYLTPKDTPTRRAAGTYLADALGGKEAPTGGLNDSLFAATADAKGVRYGYGSKNINSGSIDCSGWVQTAMKKAGAPQDVIDQLSGKNAAAQVIGTGTSSNTLAATNNITRGGLKEGQLIGVRNNASRAEGIGHVGIVVRNPDTGELGISHSSGKGVNWQPVASFQRDFGKHGFVTSDPLAASREISKEEKAKKEEDGATKALATNTASDTSSVVAAVTGTEQAGTTALGSEPTTPALGVETPQARNASEQGVPTGGALAANTNLPDAGSPSASIQDQLLASSRSTNQNNTASQPTPSSSKDDRMERFIRREEETSGLSRSSTSELGASPEGSSIKQVAYNGHSVTRPNVTPTLGGRPAERPLGNIETATTTQQVLQPIVIQQPQPHQQNAGSITAGDSSLPTVVDSPAVLAFQLDPTTPVHA